MTEDEIEDRVLTPDERAELTQSFLKSLNRESGANFTCWEEYEALSDEERDAVHAAMKDRMTARVQAMSDDEVWDLTAAWKRLIMTGDDEAKLRVNIRRMCWTIEQRYRAWRYRSDHGYHPSRMRSLRAALQRGDPVLGVREMLATG